MDEPIEERYFNWLYSNVSDINTQVPQLQYFNLLGKLHQMEFIFLVSGDDNRIVDGQDLRAEFFREEFIHNDGSLDKDGCSVLEMLIAFSRRAYFATDDSAHAWFWIMMTNLGLVGFNDANPRNDRAIQSIIDRFVYRTYNHKGMGGLFPLSNTHTDQRKVEIWYQFNEYLLELGYD